MTTVEAIYQNGVFRPLGEVKLPENQRVKLEVEPVRSDAIAWFEEMRRARDELAAKYGLFPDTTAMIAEDRRRDV